MKKLFLFWIILFYSVSFSFGQGIIRGKVKDENGESVIGASIVLKSNRSYGVTTDLDGNYSLKITDSTPQVIIISFISYKTIEETVNPVNGEVIIKNYFLVPAAHGIKEVEVTAKAVRAKEYYTEMIKKNSAITLDYISSETMKKTGDNNVTAALARVTGVSTNGSFITVRGIGDRYVKTTINGLRIPTLDPFTNNIKLDLFPASLVDNIFITKTASPDLPGDWAGAYMSVETKDYPDELSLNVETSFGYNNQSTFKDVISSQKSSTDWLGYDNGYRNHNHDNFVRAILNQDVTLFQEFVALGLGSYYNSIGITEDTPFNETFYKLSLVELQLLAPAQFDDANAVSIAKSAYQNGSYKADAFKIINSNVPAFAKSFPNNWNTIHRKAPLNFSQSFSVGNQTKLFGKPLGFITGFRYGSSIDNDRNASSNRQATDGTFINAHNISAGETTVERNGWSALANLAYKLNPNNSISILFMPNVTGVNNVRYLVDYADPLQLHLSKDQFYESRKQLVYQLKSDHYIPAYKVRLELNASYTDGNSEAPDFKRVEYTSDRDFGNYGIGQDVNRSYRYLSEDVFDSRFSVEVPIKNLPGLVRKFKFGGAYQETQRNSEQFDYTLRYGQYANTTLGNVKIEDFFSYDKFEFSSGVFNGVPYNTLDLNYNRVDNPSNFTIGFSKIKSGFVLLDYSIFPSLRVSGGLRIEQAEIFTDAYKYDSLNLSTDDPRRQFPGELLTVRIGKLDKINYLPSVNLIYKLKNDEQAPVNVRLNYSKTVARPSIRELTDVVVYDYELRAMIYGNSELKIVSIDNYDLRLESYFASGDNVSLSLFYKDFKDHIEISDAPQQGFTWINVDKSRVIGLELEGKKSLNKNFELRVNLTLVDSRTEYLQKALLISNGIRTYLPIGDVSRTMYGQAPYVVNGMINYSTERLGLSISVNYNIQGPRLFLSSFNKEFEVYELPRHQLDTKITQKLSKHFNLSVTVKDILQSPVRRSYNRNDGWVLDYDKYTYGTNYSLGISYRL